MRKTNLLTVRQLKDNLIYVRDLKYVSIEVLPCDAYIYEDEELTTVDFLVKRKNDLNDTINSMYGVPVSDMKNVLSYLVEIYAPDNYLERHVIEFKSLDNRCIERLN